MICKKCKNEKRPSEGRNFSSRGVVLDLPCVQCGDCKRWYLIQDRISENSPIEQSLLSIEMNIECDFDLKGKLEILFCEKCSIIRIFDTEYFKQNKKFSYSYCGDCRDHKITDEERSLDTQWDKYVTGGKNCDN